MDKGFVGAGVGRGPVLPHAKNLFAMAVPEFGVGGDHRAEPLLDGAAVPWLAHAKAIDRAGAKGRHHLGRRDHDQVHILVGVDAT